MTTYQIIGLIYAIVGIATATSLAYEANKRKTLDITFLPISGILILITRVLIGLLFFYSGFVKANDYIGFAYKLDEYFMVFGNDFPAFKGFFDFFIPFSKPLAWFISVFEIALAIAIIVGWRMRLTAWLSLIMMIFFTVLTGYSHYTGAVADCGCFGDALKIEPWESFVKDIILTGMLIPLFLVRKSVRPLLPEKISHYVVAGSFLLAGIFSWYCHEHLPWKDYRAYKVGVDLEQCKDEILPGEDFPACADWAQFYDEYPIYEGQTLLIIMYNIGKAPEDAVRESESLFQSLQGKGVKVFGVTATGRDKVEENFKPLLGLSYPFTYIDEKALKTAVRSNPGYILLHEGVIVKKWHHNDTPSADEIASLLQ